MKKIRGIKGRLRLSVFRSNKMIYAQIINDEVGRTLVAAGEKDLSEKAQKEKDQKSKTEKAWLVGKLLAKRALKKKVKKVVFDRRHYKYHGRVKALAEGAREGGLEF